MADEELIESQNELFLGQKFPKPRRATTVYDAKGEPIFRCPYCGECSHPDECDCMGAEPDCLFCNNCNREFET